MVNKLILKFKREKIYSMRKFAGIEINDGSLSAIVLTKGVKDYNLENFEHIKFSNLVELKEAFKTISDLISKDCLVSVSLPADNFYIRNFKVPFNSKDKISKIISFELENQLPVDIDLIKTDFKVTEDKTVLSFSYEKEKIQNQISELNEYGIKTDIITISGLPWAEFYNSKYPSDKTLLIYINYDKITYFFSCDNGISFIKTIYGQVKQESFQTKLISDLKLSIHAYFESTGSEFIPENVVVTGAGSTLYNFDEIFKSNFGIPVAKRDLIDDFNNIKNSESSSLFSLAIYERTSKDIVNLCKGKNSFVRFIEENRKPVIRSGVFLCLLIIFSFFNSLNNFHNLNKKASLYDKKIEGVLKRSFPKTRKIVDPLIQMKSKVRELRKKNPAINTNIKKIDILDAISKAIPDSLNVTFNKFMIGRGIISISGKTDTFILVDTIKKRLETIPFFNTVTMSSPSKSRGGGKVNFRLTIKLKRQ